MPTINTLVDFSGLNGQFPYSTLILDPTGDLFGTTLQGGADSIGTVFEVPFVGGSYSTTPSVLASFDGADGGLPYGGLILDPSDDLFGTASQGGAGFGTVFTITNTGGVYATSPTVLVSFTAANGNPSTNLVADGNGDLFGTTATGGVNGGTVFEVADNAGIYSSTPITLVSFAGAIQQTPSGPLFLDSFGNLIGETTGSGNAGTIFEITPNGSGGFNPTPVTLVTFTGTTGAAPGSSPTGGLVADAAGDLFGTTSGGGTNGIGTVFELVKSGDTYTFTNLATFNGADGGTPNGGVVIDADGDLFGTTADGGANSDGTVFELTDNAGVYSTTPSTVLNFDGNDGTSPVGGLVADSSGDLFGTTLMGGTGTGGTVFEVTDSGFVTCFLAGTKIATPDGEVFVERLVPGGEVLTVRGQRRRIVWIGEGRVLATRGRRNAATPVIVRKDALAHNVPYYDLRVTKAHSIYIDGVLIPVEFLVNHRSIIWDDHAKEVTHYHVELETHDILLANGAPAESYRDDGNRWLFQNANTAWDQPPQQPCAPVLTGGPVVDAVWRRLLDRSGPRQGLPMTDDPDLHLLVDGKRVDPVSHSGMLYVFRLGERSTSVRIASRAGAPQELGFARDPRCLGVALRQIAVSQGIRLRTIEAEDPRLTAGFHDFEADSGIRWTDGYAAVPTDLFDGFAGPLEITLRLGGTTSYLEEGVMQQVA